MDGTLAETWGLGGTSLVFMSTTSLVVDEEPPLLKGMLSSNVSYDIILMSSRYVGELQLESSL